MAATKKKLSDMKLNAATWAILAFTVALWPWEIGQARLALILVGFVPLRILLEEIWEKVLADLLHRYFRKHYTRVDWDLRKGA